MRSCDCLIALLIVSCLGCTSADERLRLKAGDLQLAQDYSGALKLYDQSIALNPQNGHTYNDRGCARRGAGDQVGAMADFNEGIRIEPSYDALYYNRGLQHVHGLTVKSSAAEFSRANMEAALADFSKSLQISPRKPDAHIGRFNVLIVQRNIPAAAAELEHWLAIGRMGRERTLWVGVKFLLQHQDAEAQRLFEIYFRGEPGARQETQADIEAIRAARGFALQKT